ncbi:MAG: YkgJ family cysteine cluster protein [Candidatus Thorarchaeota archaeon]|nr:YkgJ family cysteine cluster protein [Candidatus Thorarchaeota archaeon]
MSEKSKFSFKCLEQKCDTKACHIRQRIDVTMGDIARWTSQNYLSQIIPGITLSMPSNENEPLALTTLRKPLESDPEQTACIFYHEESNGCTIRYARPISCRAFPLEYNGEKYYLSDKNCPGVGEGEVNKDALKEVRNLAEQEYRERIETLAALPGIYSIFMGMMIRQSADAMKDLSEEDKKHIEDIMSKSSEDEKQDE